MDYYKDSRGTIKNGEEKMIYKQMWAAEQEQDTISLGNKVVDLEKDIEEKKERIADLKREIEEVKNEVYEEGKE